MSKAVQELTDDDLDLMFLVNTKSVLYGMQTVVPYFKQQKKGQVVNVSSLLGRVPFASLRSAYRRATQRSSPARDCLPPQHAHARTVL